MSDVLDIMYNKVHRALKLDDKIVDDSVIMSFLNLKSNARITYLKEGSCDAEVFKHDLSRYLNEGIIVSTAEPGKYCLSAKYIWNREQKHIIENEAFLKYLESKIFKVDSKESKLSDKHKVVVVLLLVCRVFDEDTVLNLKLNDDILDRCESLLLAVYDVLAKFGVITKLAKDDLFGKQGNEHKVSNVLRHTDSILKSGVPFRANGKQQYYLDIIDDRGNIDKTKLKVVFLKVLDRKEKMTFCETEEFYKDINDLTSMHAIYITENNNKYLDRKYEQVIKEVLDYLYD